MGKVALVIVGILFLAVSGMPAHSATEAKVDAGRLFEKRCSVRHSTDRPKCKKKTA